MLVFVATALAGTVSIGWPCQRLNWGWRNVWSTCSINSFVPVAAGTLDTGAGPNTGWRVSATGSATTMLASTGVFTPNGPLLGSAANTVPALLCTNAAATGSGATAVLRNRCRRAIDAYGALVKSCTSTVIAPRTAGGSALATPDFMPALGHAPHVANVQGLTINAQLCTLPAGINTPDKIGTPSTTCPGLLGWFTVVFNVCGFTNAPGLTPTNQQTPLLQSQNTPNYLSTATGFLPNTLVTSALAQAPVSPQNGVGWFCGGTPTTPVATSWQAMGAHFRTGRCRKALDQFGRTATRCHMSAAPYTGPAQAGGYSDPLRFLAVGNVAAQAAAGPLGINVWAPACNLI